MARWWRWLSDGGLVYVNREIDHSFINTFRFKVIKSKNMEIWIGLEKKKPRLEWWFWLRDGAVYDSDSGDWMPYAKPVIAMGNDEISMQLDGSELSFIVNGKNLGVAFNDKWLSEPLIRPFVFIGNHQDKVEILDGMTLEK